MYARYPGTSGRQHGDRNVTAPAAAATGMASSSGPDDDQAGHAHACPGSVGTSVSVGMVPSMAESG